MRSRPFINNSPYIVIKRLGKWYDKQYHISSKILGGDDTNKTYEIGSQKWIWKANHSFYFVLGKCSRCVLLSLYIIVADKSCVDQFIGLGMEGGLGTLSKNILINVFIRLSGIRKPGSCIEQGRPFVSSPLIIDLVA